MPTDDHEVSLELPKKASEIALLVPPTQPSSQPPCQLPSKTHPPKIPLDQMSPPPMSPRAPQKPPAVSFGKDASSPQVATKTMTKAANPLKLINFTWGHAAQKHKDSKPAKEEEEAADFKASFPSQLSSKADDVGGSPSTSTIDKVSPAVAAAKGDTSAASSDGPNVKDASSVVNGHQKPVMEVMETSADSVGVGSAVAGGIGDSLFSPKLPPVAVESIEMLLSTGYLVGTKEDGSVVLQVEGPGLKGYEELAYQYDQTRPASTVS